MIANLETLLLELVISVQSNFNSKNIMLNFPIRHGKCIKCEKIKYFIAIPRKKLSIWKKCFWLITIPRVLLGLLISFFVLLLLMQYFWQFYSLLYIDHQSLKRLNLLFSLMECKPEEGYTMDWPKCYSDNKNHTNLIIWTTLGIDLNPNQTKIKYSVTRI